MFISIIEAIVNQSFKAMYFSVDVYSYIDMIKLFSTYFSITFIYSVINFKSDLLLRHREP